MESSPDNDGTGRHCQTARVRQARQRGVTRVNQWLNPLKRGTSSNLVDMGWAAVCVDFIDEGDDFEIGFERRQGGHGECLRRSRGKAAGEKLGAHPANRDMVNMGTTPGSPSPPHSQCGGGQAHRRLMSPGVGRRVRSSPRTGKPSTWRRDPASPQQKYWHARRSPVNTDALWPTLEEAEARVLGIQTKLHQWATDSPNRRFSDLYNLVCDPAFLTVAWARVRRQSGRTLGRSRWRET